MTLEVAVGEAVAHSQGCKGRVWPWEEDMGVLDAQVNFLLGKGQSPLGVFPEPPVSVAGHSRAWGKTGDPSPPRHRSPSVTAQRRQPPTATATATTALPSASLPV